ncbi:glycolate oxidase iron-sulfur subunit [Rhizobiales bacterium GAS191]|nr:glycolate oxidase iron-sulfur subunit [Rhizobiales bacterium GAS191]
MQTNFTTTQLADPAMASSEKILRSCVHCGFCTATCPTYLLLGDELDSPRGRIYLIKDMLEGEKPASAEVVKHIDRCLSCLSCMTTCPSGVHYMHLVDHARAYIEKSFRRPLGDRFLRAVLAAILPYPGRFRLALKAAKLGKPLKKFLRAIPSLGERLGAMLELAPDMLPAPPAAGGPTVFPATGPRKARVALLGGCAQKVLQPSINAATIRLLNRLGVEVVLAEEGCCGALVHHMGREAESHAFAARAIDAWHAEIARGGLDAIVITASGCGTTIKDYGFMFRNDQALAEKAAKVSGLAKDISEYLVGLDLPAPSHRTGLTVAYHSACSMQHGQKIIDEPKRLLRAAGFSVKDVPEGHICCGSAGVYNMLQPEIAGRLRERKVDNIARTRPDIVATGNIGCVTQIAKGFADRAAAGGPAGPSVLHTVELLDWALGGPAPEGLDRRLPASTTTPISPLRDAG